MVTDYDSPEIRSDVGEISNVFLKCQIDLDHVPEEIDSNWNNRVLVKPNVNPRRYEALRQANNARLKQVCLKASGSDKYKQLNDALIEEQACKVSGNTPPVLLDQTRCKKKRKVLDINPRYKEEYCCF